MASRMLAVKSSGQLPTARLLLMLPDEAAPTLYGRGTVLKESQACRFRCQLQELCARLGIRSEIATLLCCMIVCIAVILQLSCLPVSFVNLLFAFSTLVVFPIGTEYCACLCGWLIRPLLA